MWLCIMANSQNTVPYNPSQNTERYNDSLDGEE